MLILAMGRTFRCKPAGLVNELPSPGDIRVNGATRAGTSRVTTVRPPLKELISMADPVPAGSDVSAGTYRCTNCGYELDVQSTSHVPPCPSCGNGQWDTVSGGDSVDDPYPGR
jgi:hypothetical protein